MTDVHIEEYPIIHLHCDEQLTAADSMWAESTAMYTPELILLLLSAALNKH